MLLYDEHEFAPMSMGIDNNSLVSLLSPHSDIS
jgi:hypothetical protein